MKEPSQRNVKMLFSSAIALNFGDYFSTVTLFYLFDGKVMEANPIFAGAFEGGTPLDLWAAFLLKVVPLTAILLFAYWSFRTLPSWRRIKAGDVSKSRQVLFAGFILVNVMLSVLVINNLNVMAHLVWRGHA